MNCHELKEFIIPTVVATIERSAFFGTDKLTIYAAAAEKPAGWNVIGIIQARKLFGVITANKYILQKFLVSKRKTL